MGETIKEIDSTDNCTSTIISCVSNKGNSQIRIKTKNKCNEHLKEKISEHANISDMNVKKLEDKINGVENLLQIFLHKTGGYYGQIG